MTESVVTKSGIGPVESTFTKVSGNDLGTTPIKPALQDIGAVGGGRPRVFKVRIHNPNATAYLAFDVVPRGTLIGSVVLNATPGASPSSNTGMMIPPGGTELYTYESALELVIVASAAASLYNIGSTLFG